MNLRALGIRIQVMNLVLYVKAQKHRKLNRDRQRST
jgi:hypothetical protein